jgi:putative colanic acid biosynthesis acetyltransferase WcaF
MPKQIHYNAAEHIPADAAADPYLRPAFSFRDRLRRLNWNICWALLYRTSPRPLHSWRSFLLRLFGAKMGADCHFYPRSKVWAPWNLICADQVTAGDGAEIYNPAPVTMGSHAILSQDAYVCTATHDYDDPAFPLISYATNVRMGVRARIGCTWSECGRGRSTGIGVGCNAEYGCVDSVRGCPCRQSKGETAV